MAVTWSEVTCGVPRGGVVSPYRFLPHVHSKDCLWQYDGHCACLRHRSVLGHSLNQAQQLDKRGLRKISGTENLFLQRPTPTCFFVSRWRGSPGRDHHQVPRLSPGDPQSEESLLNSSTFWLFYPDNSLPCLQPYGMSQRWHTHTRHPLHDLLPHTEADNTDGLLRGKRPFSTRPVHKTGYSVVNCEHECW